MEDFDTEIEKNPNADINTYNVLYGISICMLNLMLIFLSDNSQNQAQFCEAYFYFYFSCLFVVDFLTFSYSTEVGSKNYTKSAVEPAVQSHHYPLRVLDGQHDMPLQEGRGHVRVRLYPGPGLCAQRMEPDIRPISWKMGL